jgi:hypothetical protein
MSTNPYTAPKAPVADPERSLQGNFVAGGRTVRAGRGASWFIEGWALFKAQPGMWMIEALLVLLVMAALQAIQVAGRVGGLLLVQVLGQIVYTVLWPVFVAGLLIGCQAIVDGEGLRVGHLFAGFRQRFGTLIGVGATTFGILAAIWIAVALLMGVGLASLFGGIQPQKPEQGLVLLLAMLVALAVMLPVFMAIWFAPALVVFHDQGVLQAMKESFQGCLRNVLPFLVYGLVGLVLGTAVAVVIGIGVALTAGGLGASIATAIFMIAFLALGLMLLPVFLASIYAGYRDIYFRP